MFYSYPMNKKYYVSDSTVEHIVKIIDKYDCKNIFYVGYADKNLVVKIKNKNGCKIVLADYFDVTRKQLHFWDEGDGIADLDEMFPVPDWAKDVEVHIDGITKHDILLLDLPHNASFEYAFPEYSFAKVVLLFGEADFETFTDKHLYFWREENNIKIGILKI